MKKNYFFEEWQGKKFPAREIDKVPDYEDLGTVEVAEYGLWEAIEADYEDENSENHTDAVAIDNEIFFYVEPGYLAGNPSDKELREYLKKNA